MAVISFSGDPEKSWLKAGWVVRQILDDVLSQYPGDSALASDFDFAREISGLVLDEQEPEPKRKRITTAFRHTVTGILSGTIRSGIHDKPYGDERTVEQYHHAL